MCGMPMNKNGQRKPERNKIAAIATKTWKVRYIERSKSFLYFNDGLLNIHLSSGKDE